MKVSFIHLFYIAFLAFALNSQALYADDETSGEADGATEATAVMSQPLDVDSNEALKASMNKVKAEATPEEWRAFNNAVGKIRAFDLAARNDPEVLLQRVNGKTPLQIIDYASERWK